MFGRDISGEGKYLLLSIWRDGNQISDIFSAGYNVHGVVVPKMDPATYLVLLALIGVLLVVPAGMRRFSKRQPDV